MEGVKSLNETKQILSKEQHDYLIEEGFEPGRNNSYCLPDDNTADCYEKSMGDVGGSYINIYVSKSGIGIDLDYDCGGNSSTRFWHFNNHNFKEAYNEMVEAIQDYQK